MSSRRVASVSKRYRGIELLGLVTWSLSSQCTIECLHLRASHRVLPAFGLDVDLFEAKPVQRDHPVDPAVSRATHPLQIAEGNPTPQLSDSWVLTMELPRRDAPRTVPDAEDC